MAVSDAANDAVDAMVRVMRSTQRHFIGAIDPGPTKSAFVTLTDDGVLTEFGIVPNGDLLLRCRRSIGYDLVVIEQMQSYGMPVGREVFDTVHWAGRFTEALSPTRVEQLSRKRVVTAICGSANAKDANVRQALIDRFGGDGAQRKGGPLYGVTKDVWSALAIAVAWQEGARP